ncbi:unnamed protein product, partial [Prorocentrum cordatum]
MKALVEYGHSLGLKVGTYLNNCICMEVNLEPHYEEDVRWFTDMGFDGVKIDGCGSSHNVSYYADLFNATGRPVRIENCHNSWPDFSTGSCPMHFFRTGGDIGPSMDSILTEAYSTIDAADLLVPRSGPGCWAYLMGRRLPCRRAFLSPPLLPPSLPPSVPPSFPLSLPLPSSPS